MTPEEVKTVMDTLVRVETAANRAVRAIEGDPSVGHVGLAQRMSLAEGEISSHKAWRETVKAKMAVIATIVSSVGTMGTEFLIRRLGGGDK